MKYGGLGLLAVSGLVAVPAVLYGAYSAVRCVALCVWALVYYPVYLITCCGCACCGECLFSVDDEEAVEFSLEKSRPGSLAPEM